MPKSDIDDGPRPLNPWQGVMAEFMADTTEEIDLEGALSSSKTTACLCKVRQSTIDHPGIWWFICRYSNADTESKLRPAFEEVCKVMGGGELPSWDNTELCYHFANGSKVYAFGIKAADKLSRYAKLRGLGVAGIYNDQTEELPGDLALELRARIRQRGFPHQLIFSPNPPNVTHWLAKADKGGFPEDNSVPGRKYYAVSLYDNAHNLPPETIARLERTYPPWHAKHKCVILGKRGVNVIGDAVYENAFIHHVHERPVLYDAESTLLEAFDYGKHNLCVLWAQRRYAGGLSFVGGILGQELFLEDFLPIVMKYRQEWFPPLTRATVKTCCTATSTLVGATRFTGVRLLRDAKFFAVSREGGNSPDVVDALIQRIASYMRRRTFTGEEALAVNSDENHFLKASREGIEPCPFLSQAFGGGYVWDPHTVSVGSNQVRQPQADDWFEHGMRCAEAIEHNFCAEKQTDEARDRRAADQRAEAANQSAAGGGPLSWMGS